MKNPDDEITITRLDNGFKLTYLDQLDDDSLSETNFCYEVDDDKEYNKAWSDALKKVFHDIGLVYGIKEEKDNKDDDEEEE